MYTWKAKNRMQYSASEAVESMVVLLSQMASEAITDLEHLISKTFLGKHAPRPP